ESTGVRCPLVRTGGDGDAKSGEPAGHQGRRGSGNDRLNRGRDERRCRRARTIRGQGRRDAGYPTETLGADAPQRRDKTMTPAAFDYVVPRTLPEAVAELVKHGQEAKVLAGWHSLIPLMKLRLSTPSFLVDIGRIGNLSYIREEDGHIAIGALTSHHDVEFSDLLKNKVPLLTSAASQIGDPQVRNRGTIGGAASHADPNGDFPACLLALDAEFKVGGPKGERSIAAKDFFVDTFTTSLEPNEILREIRIATPAPGSR